MIKYLHCDDSVIDDVFFGEEVCADGGFVLGAEFFVYLSLQLCEVVTNVLIHEGCLADTECG
jgi:hypothetical protein